MTFHAMNKIKDPENKKRRGIIEKLSKKGGTGRVGRGGGPRDSWRGTSETDEGGGGTGSEKKGYEPYEPA